MKYREKRFLSDKYGFKICKIRFTTQLNLANDDYSFKKKYKFKDIYGNTQKFDKHGFYLTGIKVAT